MPKKIGVLLPYRMDNELVEFVKENLNLGAELAFRGAQDGMDDDQLRELGRGIAPNSYAEILGDGSTIFISRDTVVEGMRKQTENLLNDGCDAVMICCSLPWPELDSIKNVVTPNAILESSAVSISAKGGTIGVMQPIREAMDDEIQHWLALGKKHSLGIVSEFAAPQVPGEAAASTAEIFTQAAQSQAEKGAELIVLDCMAYTDAHRVLVARASGKPVLRAMSLTASVLAQAYGLDDRSN